MVMKRTIKNSNKGSTLVMVLLIVFMLSTLAIAFMFATLSSYRTSILSGDLKTANFIAEAGVERIAKVLDKKVFEVQQSAKNDATNAVYALLANEKALAEGGFLTGDGDINYSKIDDEFTTLYNAKFKAGLAGKFAGIGTETGILYGQDAAASELDIHQDGVTGTATLHSAGYTEYALRVGVTGTYKEYTTGMHTVVFNLLPETEKIPYVLVPKIRVKNIEPPDLLSKYAMISGKNLIVANGILNVDGDVLAFGTVPASSPGVEDQDADWQKYGGVVAGIPEAGDTADTYLAGSITAKTGVMKTGEIHIDGSAATMSYIHTLFGNSAADTSQITITGDVYARSLRTEEDAFYSQMRFGKDAYVMDNLQIDSDNSEVSVAGKYLGFVTAGYDIDGGGSGETYEYKKTSSIVVNGNSTLHLNGKKSNGGIFIGGTSFLNDYRAVSGGKPYMLGISASASNWNLIEAYRYRDDFVRYGNTPGDKRDTDKDNNFAQYVNNSFSPSLSEWLLERDDSDNYLGKKERGFHLKGYWMNEWGSHKQYPMDTQRIVIDTDTDDKIFGFLNGALAANESVFNPFEIFNPDLETADEPMLEADFKESYQQAAKESYYNAVRYFFNETYGADDPNIKLDYTAGQRNISSYLDEEISSIREKRDGYILYYKEETDPVEIKNTSSGWTIDGEALPGSGIIIARGDIYIENGLQFNGVILSEGNIVFYGDRHTSNIQYDENVVKDMLTNSAKTRFLFKIYKYEGINDTGEKTQRISLKNIAIKQWEVD